MTKFLCALIVVLVLAGCSSRYSSAPQQMENACSVLKQRPKFSRAFRSSEQKWGVPIHVMMATIHQESKFIKNAKTPRKYFLGIIPRGRVSSAYGYAQALDGTWNEYRQKTGRRWAQRSNIQDTSDFIGWYMTTSKRRNGVSLSDARNQYLNYHEGHSGYARGSYKNKRWLMLVADKVAKRAAQYRTQLRQCRI
jgi:hypothetical protein